MGTGPPLIFLCRPRNVKIDGKSRRAPIASRASRDRWSTQTVVAYSARALPSPSSNRPTTRSSSSEMTSSAWDEAITWFIWPLMSFTEAETSCAMVMIVDLETVWAAESWFWAAWSLALFMELAQATLRRGEGSG